MAKIWSLYQSNSMVSPFCIITLLSPFGSADSGTTGTQLSPPPPPPPPSEAGDPPATDTSVALQTTELGHQFLEDANFKTGGEIRERSSGGVRRNEQGEREGAGR